MFKSNLLNKKNVSLLIFFFVNILFGIKYLSRVSEFYPVFIIFFATIYFFLLSKNHKSLISILDKLKISMGTLFIFYIISTLILFYLIPKETLHVDRWSVISSFWDNYFTGKYVYYAQSFDGNFPGPMPFYFIMALPFYLIGELGLYSLLGILLFIYNINSSIKNNVVTKIVFFLIVTSLFYIWEISTRSNIFLNGSLVLICISFFMKKYKNTIHSDILFGLIFGCALSTRNVYVIPLIITILYAIKAKKINFKHLVLLGIFTMISFVVTFIPFVWNHFGDFKIMNPFIIQSTFLMPLKYTISFILLSFLSVLVCKDESDVYFYSGLVLFLTILFYFIYVIFNTNFEYAFYKSAADISYFILCLPFFIFHYFYDNRSQNV